SRRGPRATIPPTGAARCSAGTAGTCSACCSASAGWCCWRRRRSPPPEAPRHRLTAWEGADSGGRIWPPWEDRQMEHSATPEPAPARPAAPDPGPDVVHVGRTGTRRYVATNSRGAQVQIGGEETDGVFTPGELLAIALGACNVMTADFPLSRRLGEDFTASASVGRTKLTAENRYTAADV